MRRSTTNQRMTEAEIRSIVDKLASIAGLLSDADPVGADNGTHSPHRSLHAAAPLKPLPQPVDLDQYRIRKRAHTGGLINEYRLVA
jgi:hypothetical protein